MNEKLKRDRFNHNPVYIPLEEKDVYTMGALGILGGLTVLLAFVLLFLGIGMPRGSVRRGGTSISGPIFFILLVMGILMILGEITWPL